MSQEHETRAGLRSIIDDQRLRIEQFEADISALRNRLSNNQSEINGLENCIYEQRRENVRLTHSLKHANDGRELLEGTVRKLTRRIEGWAAREATQARVTASRAASLADGLMKPERMEDIILGSKTQSQEAIEGVLKGLKYTLVNPNQEAAGVLTPLLSGWQRWIQRARDAARRQFEEWKTLAWW